MVLKVIRFVARLILYLIARVEIIDMDKIPNSGGCVAVANHIGRLDAMLAIILAERDDIIMLIAEKYQKYAIWRWAARKVDAIWLNRFETDFHALREAYKRLQAGGMLTMAPEGTRSPSKTLDYGKPGATYLAAKAGVPIVPVAFTGTGDEEVISRLKRLRRLHITIRVGDPFMLPPMDRRNRDAYLREQTDEIMCRIAALLPPEYRGVYEDHPCLQELAHTQRQPV